MRLRKLGDRVAAALAQALEHVASRRVRQRCKDEVEILMLNH